MQIDRPIAIALILFAVLLLVFFLVLPEYKTFKSLREEFAEKKAEYDAKFDYYAAITKAYYDLQSREDGIKKIDSALPESPELGNIVYFLQKTAGENGIILKDLFLSKSAPSNIQTTGDAKKIRDISFTLDLIGSYSSLERFASSLEKSARLFEVTSISFGTSINPAAEASGQSGSSPKPQAQNKTQQTNSFSLQVRTHSY